MQKPILSTRTDDPEVSDLIDEFLVGLAERVDGLQDAERRDDFEELSARSSVLAGDAQRLGFGVLAASAMDLESCCQAGARDDAREVLIELTELAKRIRMGHRGAV